jgi:hypothetical protein
VAAVIKALPDWSRSWGATARVWRVHPGYAKTLEASLREIGCTVVGLVLALKFHQIFHQAAAAESVLSAVRALVNMIVELAHKDGSVVRALMSRSALMRTDDQIALATFQDLTEQLWADER